MKHINSMDMKSCLIVSALAFLAVTGCNRTSENADAFGTFEATEITVSAMANGKIIALMVEEGQVVDSGKVVGYIDTTDLHLKKLQVADQRSGTSSRISDLEAQVALQVQNRDNLLIEKERLENLFRSGAATQKQLDDLNANLRMIDRQIAAIKSQYTGIYNQVGSLNQQIAQLEEAIHNALIINPVTGTVLNRFAERDEVTVYGKALYKIADLREMTLRVYISGAKLPQVKLGQRVQVLFDRDENTNDTLQGTVSWISSMAEFTPKTIQTKEERVNLVYALKVRVLNPGSLKIGMPGEIKFY